MAIPAKHYSMNFNSFCCIVNSICDSTCRKGGYRAFRTSTFQNVETINLWRPCSNKQSENSKIRPRDICCIAQALETKLSAAASGAEESHGVEQPMRGLLSLIRLPR